MKSSSNVFLSQVEVKNKKTELYNDVLNLSNVKAPQQQVKSFENVINNATNCLWAIDTNHDKFEVCASNGHCKNLPIYFSPLYNKQYREYKQQKKSQPCLDGADLMKYSSNLYDVLSCIQGFEKLNQKLFNACHQLCDALRSYADYLLKAKERSSAHRNEAQQSIRENIVPPIESVISINLKEEYFELNQLLDDKELYEPILVHGDYVPEDRRKRYQWFKELKLCHR